MMVSDHASHNYAVTGFGTQSPPIEAISDPSLFPRRDNLIRHLVGVCGWSRQHAATIFGLSDRQLRRITTPDLLRINLVKPAKTSTMTSAEIQKMAHDYANDPYSTPEDLDAAWTYLEQGCPLVPV